MKLTDEEWSRVLGAHDAGELSRYGCAVSGGVPCLVQAARADANSMIDEYQEKDPEALALAARFDDAYDPNWSIDQLVSWMVEEGC